MILIYYADVTPLSNDILFEAAKSSLPHERQKKADSLKYREDKNLSVGAWLVLEKALSDFGVDTKGIEFESGKGGKPIIKQNGANADVHFSISHSGNIAICAVSNCPVGVDAELISQYNPKIAKRFFRKSERDAIEAQSDDNQRNDMFFRIWTLKESFVKMNGSGISGLKTFEVVPCEQSYKTDVIGCRFAEFDIPMYKVSLCTMDPDSEFVFERQNIIKPFVSAK